MKFKQFVKTTFDLESNEIERIEPMTRSKMEVIHRMQQFVDNEISQVKTLLKEDEYFINRDFIRRDEKMRDFCESKSIAYMTDRQCE